MHENFPCRNDASPLNEQCDGIITVDGSLRHLPILRAWGNSSAVYWVDPAFPTEAMEFKVGNADMTAWAATLRMCFHPKRGLWRVYVPGRYFTGRCETRYKIVAQDERGSRHVAGEGVLRVYSGGIPDRNDSPVEYPAANCYAKFPDGKWRVVTVSEDEAGAPVFSIGGEVVSDAEFEGGQPSQIFAYNNATGLYHAVTAFIDEAGEPSLSLDEEPCADGEDCFVLDPATGFHRRIEAAADEAGCLTLRTGERRA